MAQWKYDVKELLCRYRLRQSAVETLPLELMRLELESDGLRAAASDTTPVQGGGTVIEDRMLSNITRRENTARALDEARLEVERLEIALAELSADERRVLDLMYIDRQRGSVERLREELGLEDERSVYKRADRALRKLTIALYGREER